MTEEGEEPSWARAPDMPDLKPGSSSHWVPGEASLCSLQNGDMLRLPSSY